MSRHRRSSYPIERKPRREFFPHGGDRNSERHWNDVGDPLNRRRFRSDPLKDGFDPGEDPVNPSGPNPKKPDIPI